MFLCVFLSSYKNFQILISCFQEYEKLSIIQSVFIEEKEKEIYMFFLQLQLLQMRKWWQYNSKLLQLISLAKKMIAIAITLPTYTSWLVTLLRGLIIKSKSPWHDSKNLLKKKILFNILLRTLSFGFVFNKVPNF